ncbi:MAG: UDP-N-acetylglucosamine 2-epimerase (hydrolyzing) [Candidatus Marinimicrobia bacterium]|jgi:GDP/UDP-N,N'-diacetylbacillosamine 2-epimerase (hydrolysing)|nr:UDP-N-acetylglucosamine 2-epimerase (hydrolyzing) [Candidatus Neomarinimicrobiota bacterium]
MSKRKICVVTGTRAEYGLLSMLMKSINDDTNLELVIIATGSHLSPEFGLTYKEIENDGFHIDKKIETILSADTPTAIAKSTGLGMIGIADALSDLQPDLMIVVGDRYELLAASFSAVTSRIPIAHIHGGETTEGAFDESIRHSITKMSWWHFAAAEEYRKRIIQLGENPERVFNVGGLGVDIIKNSQLLSKEELIKKTGINFSSKNLLVTYHPVTLEDQTSKDNMHSLLEVLTEMNDINLIFTMPNADSDRNSIFSMIETFVSNYSDRAIVFTSMGHLNYMSTLQFVDGVIGNSSSGLLEAPSYQIGTINIGDRQKGRLKAESVIDCEPTKDSIKSALEIMYSKKFRSNLKSVLNPYGEGNATKKILEILKNSPLPKEIKKEFHNL